MLSRGDRPASPLRPPWDPRRRGRRSLPLLPLLSRVGTPGFASASPLAREFLEPDAPGSGSGPGDGLEQQGDGLVGGGAVGFALEGEQEAVAQHVRRQVHHILGQHVVAALEEGQGP